MTLHDRVQLILQQWLSAHNEDAAWLRGTHCGERQAAYERALDAVHRKLIRECEWREWVAMQAEVVEIIQELCEVKR